LLQLIRRILNPVVGYLLVLLGFAFLGLFVAALAFRSAFAVVMGIGLVASFGLAVAAFRNGSATLATAREAGFIGDNVSIWARPLLEEQIDGYRLNYRPEQRRPQPDEVPAARHVSRLGPKRGLASMPTRLSA
jgi:hypothetical protein